MCKVGQNRPCIYTVYDRIFGDFPVKNTVYTPYINGPGQPYLLAYRRCKCVLEEVHVCAAKKQNALLFPVDARVKHQNARVNYAAYTTGHGGLCDVLVPRSRTRTLGSYH